MSRLAVMIASTGTPYLAAIPITDSPLVTTWTIRVLTGISRPTAGTAAIFGHDIERDVIAAGALLDRGSLSVGELARTLGRPDWQVRNLPRQARSFTSDELVGLLRAAAAAEAEMKTSRDARLVFERWIVKVCG